MAYEGTLLLVTHDRYLMNSLECPILYLEDGKATLYESYEKLMARHQTAQVAVIPKAESAPKQGYGKEQRKRKAELRTEIKKWEDKLEQLGIEEETLSAEMNMPDIFNAPALLQEKSLALVKVHEEQEKVFELWEKALAEQKEYEESAE